MSTDIVTQIQEALDRLSTGLFSTVGALQRDAQPASVRGEPSPTFQGNGRAQEMAGQWAAEVMAMSKTVDDLLDQLPEVDTTEKEELARIVDAMRANDTVGEALRKEATATRNILSTVRSLHAALADAELARRSKAFNLVPHLLPPE